MRTRIAVCATILWLSAVPGVAQRPPIDEPTVLILVRNVMLALAHANQTGNFSVFRDLGSASFQQENSTVQLTDLYAALRQNQIDLTPLAIIEPQFTSPVGLTESGQLRLTGLFPTHPYRVLFDMAFEPAADRWRISALAIQLAAAPEASASSNDGAATPGQDAAQAPTRDGENAAVTDPTEGTVPPSHELAPALPELPRLPKPRPALGSN